MPQLSVVVPVFNERDNIPPLLAEIAAALRGRLAFEVIYIDDDSSDDSRAVLAFALATCVEAERRTLRPNTFGVARF